ncbi:hypothetical protein EJ04DRAFT_267227 [Polyplosphaeria fusca]|uniref:Uncharacterized protein n=1 Tax=Polyplosphaeria fusca TaxID=682080 RepID=A0A9P4V209_9PLEO|nr:hypothetical protein EJ04DRAFT_267227 [Polyplosphaeria fusca]
MSTFSTRSLRNRAVPHYATHIPYISDISISCSCTACEHFAPSQQEPEARRNIQTSVPSNSLGQMGHMSRTSAAPSDGLSFGHPRTLNHNSRVRLLCPSHARYMLRSRVCQSPTYYVDRISTPTIKPAISIVPTTKTHWKTQTQPNTSDRAPEHPKNQNKSTENCDIYDIYGRTDPRLTNGLAIYNAGISSAI